MTLEEINEAIEKVFGDRKYNKYTDECGEYPNSYWSFNVGDEKVVLIKFIPYSKEIRVALQDVSDVFSTNKLGYKGTCGDTVFIEGLFRNVLEMAAE